MTSGESASRRGLPTILVGILIVFFGSPPEVHAGDSDGRLSKQAQAHYERGQDAYDRGDFDTAADELRKAYSLASIPLLLYNISLAEWRGGNLEAAVATALRARRSGLPEHVRPRNEARLSAFTAVASARDVASQVGAIPEVVDGGRAGGQTTTPTKGQGGVGLETLGWIGVGLVGGGSATLGGAFWFDRRVGEAVDRMERARRRDERAEANRILREDVRPDQTIGRILLLSGTALAATGTGLIVYDLAGRSDDAYDSSRSPGRGAPVGPRVRLGPSVEPVGVRVEFVGW